MGKRGPAPKPTALRVLHGDKPSRINTNEPPAPLGVNDPPADASAEVQEVWRKTVGYLDQMGLASPVDAASLRCFCEAIIVHEHASRLVAASEVVIKGMHGTPIRNPAVLVQGQAALTIRAFAQEFGLTPAARSQIKLDREAPSGRAERLLS